MVAGTAEVTIVRSSLLFAMGRADAAVHVENDHLRRMAVMNLVVHTPFMSTKASTFSSVANSSVSKRPIWLVEAACQPALPPTIQRAGSRPSLLGVVHIVIAAKAPENGLAKLTRHAVPSVLAGTAILENTLGHLSQADIVKLPVGEQPGISTWNRGIQASIGQKRPEGTPFRFTHRVCHIRRSRECQQRATRLGDHYTAHPPVVLSAPSITCLVGSSYTIPM